MKKSRKAFVAIIIAMILASVGALLGTVFGSDLTSWLIAIVLILVSAKAIVQFVADRLEKTKFGCIVDSITIFLLGGVVGTMTIISWWIFVIATIASAILLLVFLFGFTGHKEDDEE